MSQRPLPPSPGTLQTLASDLLTPPGGSPSPIRPVTGRRFARIDGPRPRIGPYEAVASMPSAGALEIFAAHKTSPLGFVRRALVKRVRREVPDFIEGRRRLFEEAQAIAFLEHPGVASLVDLGEDERGVFLARELIEGVDLLHVTTTLRSRGEALPFEIAAFITSEIARALHHAHAAEAPDGRPLALTHQGVSPGHVIVSRSGHVRLIGFSRSPLRIAPLDPQAPASGLRELGFVAPEVLSGAPATPACDVYAAGVLLFELLTGRPCFKGKLIGDVVQRIVKNELRLERLDEEGVPRELRRVVERSCQLSPQMRFSSANDMANALDTWVMQSQLHAGPWILAAFCEQHGLIEAPGRWTKEPVLGPSPAQAGVPTMPPAPLLTAEPPPPPPASRSTPGMSTPPASWLGVHTPPPPSAAPWLHGSQGETTDPAMAPRPPIGPARLDEIPSRTPSVEALSTPPTPRRSVPVMPPADRRASLEDGLASRPETSGISTRPAPETSGVRSLEAPRPNDPTRSIPPMAPPPESPRPARSETPAPEARRTPPPPPPPPTPPPVTSRPAPSRPTLEPAPKAADRPPPSEPPADAPTRPGRASIESPQAPVAPTSRLPASMTPPPAPPPEPTTARNLPSVGPGHPLVDGAEARTLPSMASPLAKKPAETRTPQRRPSTEPEGEPMEAPKRPSIPPWSGDLSTTRPPDVLTRLIGTQATGTLELKAGSVWKRLTFKEGRPIALTSNVGLEGIGEQLVKNKLLTRFELDKALRESPKGEEGLIDRLISTQVLGEAQLGPELGKNITDGLADVFGWRQGSFEFVPGVVHSPTVEPAIDLGQWIEAREKLKPGQGPGKRR